MCVYVYVCACVCVCVCVCVCIITCIFIPSTPILQRNKSLIINFPHTAKPGVIVQDHGYLTQPSVMQ